MQNTMRNAAKAIIVRDDHLLVTANRDSRGGEFYILPGGGQDFGETLHETLRRECIEEIGAEIEIHDLVCVRDYIGKNHEFSDVDGHIHAVEFMFLCTLSRGQRPRSGALPDSRQVGVKWIPLRELPSAPFFPAAIKALIAEVSSRRALYLGDVN
jgi:ADP-ribose pyrophosphatase YjhB (NUDIX family)